MNTYVIETKSYPAGGRAEWRVSHAIEAADRAEANRRCSHLDHARAVTIAAAMSRDVMGTRAALDRLVAKQRNTGAITPSEVARRAAIIPEAARTDLPDFSDMPSLADRAAQQYAGWKVQPETNTEAAQLNALLMDTPAGPQYAMPGLEPTAQLRMF